jgi:hypothetical protein
MSLFIPDLAFSDSSLVAAGRRQARHPGRLVDRRAHRLDDTQGSVQPPVAETTSGLPRIHLPRTLMYKGKKTGRGCSVNREEEDLPRPLAGLRPRLLLLRELDLRLAVVVYRVADVETDRVLTRPAVHRISAIEVVHVDVVTAPAAGDGVVA